MERLLSTGHERIAMVSGGASSAEHATLDRPSVSSGRDRVDGYLAALSEAGVSQPRAYLRTGAHTRQLAERLTTQLLHLPQPPTAVFASDSVVALGVLKALRAADKRIPREVSLVTFDDADWTGVVAPAISVVAQPAQELGKCAAEILLERIAGATYPARSYVKSTTFVSRDSIAPPSKD